MTLYRRPLLRAVAGLLPFEGEARAAGLPRVCHDALASGLWPSRDVLPKAERRQQGIPRAPRPLLWPAPRRFPC
ncbi:hypothetical protein [Teichococcus aestuarii]|uniref:hypothetical protein n=1 Tax=Teichococcus aestuarii TaxID=568898 RepID=UPI00361167FF